MTHQCTTIAHSKYAIRPLDHGDKSMCIRSSPHEIVISSTWTRTVNPQFPTIYRVNEVLHGQAADDTASNISYNELSRAAEVRGWANLAAQSSSSRRFVVTSSTVDVRVRLVRSLHNRFSDREGKADILYLRFPRLEPATAVTAQWASRWKSERARLYFRATYVFAFGLPVLDIRLTQIMSSIWAEFKLKSG